jgi:FKBP-type peptidyl-prolyl cis-trans isomerase FkpA
MSQRNVRLSLDGFEERLTPATAADWMAAAQQTYAGVAFFNAIKDDPDWIFNQAAQDFLQEKLTGIYQGAQSAMALTGGNGPWAAQAQALMTLSANIGSAVGVEVFTPPEPTPPLTDAEGMVFSMPSRFDPHWVAQANGLKIWDIRQGTGDPAVAGDTINVLYTGWLAATGVQFDARRTPSAPIPLSLTSGQNGVIEGWVQGIPGMKPGGIRRLLIPSALAYGLNGKPPTIPGNADLIFEVKLVSHS